jgi:hypothetical protein
VLRMSTKTGSTWSWTKDYVYRDGLLLAAVDAGGTKHFHLDPLGTPRLVTGNAGAKLADHAYYPFGRERKGAGMSPGRWPAPRGAPELPFGHAASCSSAVMASQGTTMRLSSVRSMRPIDSRIRTSVWTPL